MPFNYLMQMRTSYLLALLILIIMVIAPQLLAQSGDKWDKEKTDRLYSLVSTADSLYLSRDWSKAAQIYEQIVALADDDALSAYRLGSCYHRIGDYPSAIRAHQMATSHSSNIPLSIYNLACAYSLAGDRDNAFEALYSAIDSGYNNGDLILRDSDLDNMRDDPRFQDVLQRVFGKGYTGFDGPGPTVEQMREGIKLLVNTIQEMHPNPYRHFSKQAWNERTEEVLDRVSSLDEVGYYVEVRELAGMAADVHTSAYPRAGSSVLRDSYSLRFWHFADGLYIRAASPELEHLIGAKVVEIAKTPFQQAWHTIMSKMSTENEWMSTYMAQFHMQFPDYLQALGLGDSPTGGQWTLLMPNGDVEEVYIEATDSSGYLGVIGTSLGVTAPRGWKQGPDGLDALPMWLKQLDENYWYEYLPEHKAVFMQFNLPRNHGKPWFEFLDGMFEFIRTNAQVERLIIDLRHNEGGWAYMSQTLTHRVIQTPKINKPGHLYVLTSRVTQSAGVTISAELDRETYSIFVGEPGGAHPNFYNGPMGNHPPNALPGTDIVFRVSTVLQQESDALDDRCYVAPDIPVGMTYEDYSSGRDPVLEAALNFPDEEGRKFFVDAGGRDLSLYFHWRRPTQKEAFRDN